MLPASGSLAARTPSGTITSRHPFIGTGVSTCRLPPPGNGVARTTLQELRRFLPRGTPCDVGGGASPLPHEAASEAPSPHPRPQGGAGEPPLAPGSQLPGTDRRSSASNGTWPQGRGQRHGGASAARHHPGPGPRAPAQSPPQLLPQSPQGSQFVKSLATLYPKLPCRACAGTGTVKCSVCSGRGWLPKGGFQRRNPVDISRLVGSKWTAMERTFGWRHFRVKSKRRAGSKEWFVEMVATCDENTQLWVNAQNLKDRSRWAMGWLQKQELQGLSPSLGAPTPDGEPAAVEAGPGGCAALPQAPSASECKACRGSGFVPCKPCVAKRKGEDGGTDGPTCAPKEGKKSTPDSTIIINV